MRLSEPFPEGSVSYFLAWCEIGIEPPKDFDVEKARGVVRKKLNQVEAYLEQHRKRLSDPIFQEKASQETRWETQDRLNDLLSESSLLKKQLQSLGVQAGS